MAKAADAFRTISEVADDLGIQKHVLRFWEVKFNQIRPMKRGGGRRYYRPEDMELLRGIRQLLHRDGYTIKGVQKILREQGVEAVKQRALEEEAAAIAKSEAALQAGSPPPSATEPAPQQRPKVRAKIATPVVDRNQVLHAAIAELTKCRDVLAGNTTRQVSSGESAGKPPGRSRRSA